jgi:RND superfamily putative drug exporter
MLIVLVLGAGTDYGLFLVFRVRENLREGADPKDAARSAVTRVGETITFSALTVIAALLSLLVATFQIYSQLGIPLAIGIGTMLLAGLTLLPALLAVFGRAAFWPSKAGTDSDAGTKLLNKHFPSSAANPTNLIYKLSQPVWNNPDPINTAVDQLTASGLFTGVTGPLNPAGVTLTSAQYKSLHATLGTPARSRRSRPRATPACRWLSTRPTGPPRSTSAPTARRSSS